jgi:HEAT repeat protein
MLLLPDPDLAPQIIEDLGPRAVPELERALTNENPTIRSAAAEALGSISPVLSALESGLEDEETGVRCTTVRALGRRGPIAVDTLSNIGPAALAALERAAQDRDGVVADRAAQAMRQLK